MALTFIVKNCLIERLHPGAEYDILYLDHRSFFFAALRRRYPFLKLKSAEAEQG